MVFMLVAMATAFSQQDTLVTKEESSFITHKKNNWIRNNTVDSMVIDTLSGDVIFFQDSIVMYCDSAIILNDIDITAWGNVAIVQNDTIEMFSDTLKYNADTKKSILIGNVLLSNQN